MIYITKLKQIVFTFGTTALTLLLILTFYHWSDTLKDFTTLDFLFTTLIAVGVGTILAVIIFVKFRPYSDLNLSSAWLLLLAILLWSTSGDVAIADVPMRTIITCIVIVLPCLFFVGYGYKLLEQMR